MPKKLELPIEKKTLNLYAGDAEILEQYYPVIGWSVAVRQLVHIHAKKLIERASRTGVATNDRAEIAALADSINIGNLELASDDGDDGDADSADDGQAG